MRPNLEISLTASYYIDVNKSINIWEITHENKRESGDQEG